MIFLKPVQIALVLLLVLISLNGRAASEKQNTSDVQSSPSSSAPEESQPVKRKSKGKKPREKEAEGTQAPNRFESDTFIKSRYELNGQSLEVDTE